MSTTTTSSSSSHWSSNRSSSSALEDAVNDYAGGVIYRADRWSQDAQDEIQKALLTAPDVVDQLNDAVTKVSSMAHDARELWGIHVASVIDEAKDSMLNESVPAKVGKALSFTGELWDGLNDFWNELVDKHRILRPLDVIIIKPSLISLYAAIWPEVLIIKACEFVGRAVRGYAKTGESFSSIVHAAKIVGKSIIKHAVRLSVGIFSISAVKEFTKILHLQDRSFFDLIENPKQMQMLKRLQPGVARAAANAIAKCATHVSSKVPASKLVEPVLKALTEKLKPTMEGLVRHLEQALPELAKKFQDTCKNPAQCDLEAALKDMHKSKEFTKKDKQTVERAVRDYRIERAKGPLTLNIQEFAKYLGDKIPSRETSESERVLCAKIRGLLGNNLPNESISLEDSLKKILKLNGLTLSEKRQLSRLATDYSVDNLVQKEVAKIPVNHVISRQSSGSNISIASTANSQDSVVAAPPVKPQKKPFAWRLRRRPKQTHKETEDARRKDPQTSSNQNHTL